MASQGISQRILLFKINPTHIFSYREARWDIKIRLEDITKPSKSLILYKPKWKLIQYDHFSTRFPSFTSLDNGSCPSCNSLKRYSGQMGVWFFKLDPINFAINHVLLATIYTSCLSSTFLIYKLLKVVPSH